MNTRHIRGQFASVAGITLLALSCAKPPSKIAPPSPAPTVSGAEREPCDAARRLASEDSRLPQLCQAVSYVGFMKLEEAGLVPKGKDPRTVVAEGVSGRDELAAPWHLYKYDTFSFAIHEQTPVAYDMLLLAVAAVDTIKTKLPAAYDYMKSMMTAPREQPLFCCSWKNRFSTITILFDTTPAEIAASGTVLGASTPQDGGDITENAALISVDRETILGNDKDHGSRPIYKMEKARDNFIAYLKDGIVYTILHEMTHRYIDQRNSTSDLANALFNARYPKPDNPLVKSLGSQFSGDSPTNDLRAALRDNEEIIANETAFFFSKSVLSATMTKEHTVQNRQWLQLPLKFGLIVATGAIDKGNAKALQLPQLSQ
jgi:hypothetical protein